MVTPACEFGKLLRNARQRAGLGLRTFAMLIDQRASVVSAIESGRRRAWRHEQQLQLVARVLGMAVPSDRWDTLCAAARSTVADNDQNLNCRLPGELWWWWTSPSATTLTVDTVGLTKHLGATTTQPGDSHSAESLPLEKDNCHGWLPNGLLTDLEIEWGARQYMESQGLHLTAAPVDVEAVLEKGSSDRGAGVQLEILPGLIPQFSVEACVVRSKDQITLVIDRILADSRPPAAYRLMLAKCFAPLGLNLVPAENDSGAHHYTTLRSSADWPRYASYCQRFALSMMLPAKPVLVAADAAYRELVQRQGWESEILRHSNVMQRVHNRLAEQFSVPFALVRQRLTDWPFHLEQRVDLALNARESQLPPLDWLEIGSHKQRKLFTDIS
ncbi:MAG: helix-turn-helix transcriptional regulator [Pirellulales bacterium]